MNDMSGSRVFPRGVGTQTIATSASRIASKSSVATSLPADEVADDLDKAILVQEQAVALSSAHVDILYNYGRMLFNRGLPQDVLLAKEVWGVVGDIDPNHANTLFSLGALHEKEGEISTALSYYKRVAGLNPENKEIHKKISALTY